MASMHVSMDVLCAKCFREGAESTPAALVWSLHFIQFKMRWKMLVAAVRCILMQLICFMVTICLFLKHGNVFGNNHHQLNFMLSSNVQF